MVGYPAQGNTGMTDWGYFFTWHDRRGSTTTVSVSKAESPGRAMAECLSMAKASGYRRPRWWQWWRWREVDIEQLVREIGSGFPGHRVTRPPHYRHRRRHA